PLAAQPQGDTTDLGAPRDARAETQRTSSGPARAPTPQAVPTLAAEVEALDRAQAEIEADPEATLRRLDEYESGYRDGSLGPEAQVLRIEALARAGKIEQARALGHAFLAHHPASPHAQRVRSILAAPASAGE
ncbi:MAG: hypothetical protein HY744_19840, partial [Deltaproteobacteria bacterium]|nr:hypothetical protein [Deltaproteobacteria bacterium]